MNRSTFLTAFIAAFVAAIVSVAVIQFSPKAPKNTIPQGSEASAYVKQALLNDPLMLDEVFVALQASRQQQELAQAKVAIKSATPAIYSDSRDAVLGSKTPTFTLVEFFDYNCGYCKMAAKWTQTLLEQNPDTVQIIFKDFPVLEGRAEGSKESSVAAMALWLQGPEIFQKYHFSMMEAEGGFDSQRIDEFAKNAGADVELMRSVMQSEQANFDAHIADTMTLARSLNIDGTPAFIANNQLVHGANIEYLQELFRQSQSIID